MRLLNTSLGVLLILLFFTGCTGKPSVTSTNDYGNIGESSVGLEIGNKAPELSYKSPGGETISLSELQGKLVLIDFWAAWCPPCRRENPNLVRAFKTYKDSNFDNSSGFTIYSVSLDNNKEDWVKAIQTDNLSWKYHVSDLKGWESDAAAIYDVRGIPTNFLINGEGIIIAKNLRGERLQEKLKELSH